MTTTDLPPPTDHNEPAIDDFDLAGIGRAGADEPDDIVVLEAVDDVPLDARIGEDPFDGEMVDGDMVVGDMVVGPVDPRMRDRWVSVRRAEGRRRLRVLVACVSFASLVGIAYLIAHSPLLGADTVRVTGNAQTTSAEIRAAAHIGDGAPLLFLDTPAVARRIEQLPGVARASVSTELPSTVVITVTEREPIAWIRTPGANPVALVDRSGRVLTRVTTPPPLLAEVVGAGTAAVPGRVLAVRGPFGGLAALPSTLRARGVRFEVRGGSGVLVLAGATPAAREVTFGPMTDMAEKGAAAVAVLDALSARGEHVGVVDVQVPNTPLTK